MTPFGPAEDIEISIPALREEGDVLPDGWEVDDPYFYPRPPRGGRRGFFWGIIVGKSISIHALREEGDRSTERLLFLSS